MQRRPVSSSNIASIGWEAGEDGSAWGTLEIEFVSGHVYQYDEVPERVYLDAVGARSVGRFVAQNIVDQYEHTRLS